MKAIINSFATLLLLSTITISSIDNNTSHTVELPNTSPDQQNIPTSSHQDNSLRDHFLELSDRSRIRSKLVLKMSCFTLGVTAVAATIPLFAVESDLCFNKTAEIGRTLVIVGWTCTGFFGFVSLLGQEHSQRMADRASNVNNRSSS